ncbi:zinc ribbon domain-containing protein [Natrinema sp. H-ect1]|uniref:zinc ribbon domain-containing protein n=1 Tax=Natrinema sp. H-ect1 TaxID=3242700 RepID=UPI00359E5FD1
MLFVAQKEGEPETVDWSYAEVSAVEVNEGWTKNRITLHLSSGETVSFWNQDSEYHNTEVDYEAVKGYIEDAIPSGETFCPECGESLTGEEDFCSGCGTDLQTMTCPTCEQTLSGNENYCISCGREL